MAVADRLTEAWARLVPRVGAARTAAATAGDTATEQAAAVLAELVATDPFAVPDGEVAAVEQRAQASGSRHAAVRPPSAGSTPTWTWPVAAWRRSVRRGRRHDRAGARRHPGVG